jgi:hypothetical protein
MHKFAFLNWPNLPRDKYYAGFNLQIFTLHNLISLHPVLTGVATPYDVIKYNQTA